MGTKYTVDDNGVVTLTNNLAVDTDVLYVDTSTNKVGIGTASPGNTLHVKGSSSISGSLRELVRVEDATTETQNVGPGINFLGKNTTYGTVSYGGLSALKESATGTNTDSYLSFHTVTDPATTATEKIRITSTGSVGINTTSPTGGKLQVETTEANQAAFFRNTAAAGSSYGLYIAAGGNSSDRSIYIRDRTETLNYLLVRGDGNIGIGTASPSYNLDVVADINTRSSYRASISGQDVWEFSANSSGTDGFYIYDVTAALYRLKIDNSGNTGIGTTTPAQKLDVAGSVQLAGDLLPEATGTRSLGSLSRRFASLYLSSIIEYTSDLTFKVSGSEKVRFTASGFVGIATTSPVNQLQVGDSSGTMSLGGTPTSNASGYLKFINSNTVKNWQISTNNISSGALEFAPSTANGGSTFATPKMIMTATGVGIDTTPVASAILELVSTTQGFLSPRVTTTERDAISSPATGLEVYNTTTNTKDYYDGTTWQTLSTPTAATDITARLLAVLF